jgi:hypothetical protein
MNEFMKYSRLVLAVLVLALLAIVVPASFAQEPTDYGLSEADAELYGSANDNSGSQTNFSFDYTAELTSTAQAGGALVSGTGAVGENGLQITMEGTFDDGTGAQPFNFEIRAIEDIIYLGIDGQWIGGTADALFSQFAGGFAEGAGLPIDPAALLDPNSDAMTEMMENPVVSGLLMALFTMDPTEFVTMSRADDDGFANFVTNIDFGAAIASEAVQQGLAQAAAQSPEMAAFDLAAVTEMLQGSGLAFTQSVDPATQLIEAASIVLNIGLDPSMLGGTGDAGTVSLNVIVDIRDYGTVVEIVVPENVTMMEAPAQ